MIGSKVVVTTKHRGVFFGTLQEYNGEESVVLTDARNCVSWTKETRGFLGLAARGPQAGSRITDAARHLTLYGITSVAVCSDEAVTEWESGKWS